MIKEDKSVAEKTEAKQSGLWENVKVVIQALLLAVVIRTVLFQPFTIPSGSMMPTLRDGDFILVNKFTFGLRDPVFHHKFFAVGEPQVHGRRLRCRTWCAGRPPPRR